MIDQQMMNTLLRKIKEGQASNEERTLVLREINFSLEKLNELLEELERAGKKKKTG